MASCCFIILGCRIFCAPVSPGTVFALATPEVDCFFTADFAFLDLAETGPRAASRAFSERANSFSNQAGGLALRTAAFFSLFATRPSVGSLRPLRESLITEPTQALETTSDTPPKFVFLDIGWLELVACENREFSISIKFTTSSS